MIRMVIANPPPFSPARKIGSVSGLSSPFPSGKGSMPASRHQTVFAITHSDHLITHSSFAGITEIVTRWLRLRGRI